MFCFITWKYFVRSTREWKMIKFICTSGLYACFVVFSSNVSAQLILDTNLSINGFSNSFSLQSYRGVSDCCTYLGFDKENKFGLYNYLGDRNFGNYSTLNSSVSTVDVNFGYYLAKNGAEFNATSIETGKLQTFFTQSITISKGFKYSSNCFHSSCANCFKLVKCLLSSNSL